MSAVPPLAPTDQPSKETNKARTFNIQPVLGIVLVLLLAVVFYGGLLIFLVDGWSLLTPAGQAMVHVSGIPCATSA